MLAAGTQQQASLNLKSKLLSEREIFQLFLSTQALCGCDLYPQQVAGASQGCYRGKRHLIVLVSLQALLYKQQRLPNRDIVAKQRSPRPRHPETGVFWPTSGEGWLWNCVKKKLALA